MFLSGLEYFISNYTHHLVEIRYFKGISDYKFATSEVLFEIISLYTILVNKATIKVKEEVTVKVRERIMKCLLIEKISQNKKYSEKLEIEDASYFLYRLSTERR